ncbi:MAG: NAD(P)H-quinone oxidoreductase [Betaproteobacteria bacterium]|nr:NAD(P)H-quinone oxidoreductase [Betaproteobacteria bacterium]
MASSLPTTMRVVAHGAGGGPEVLQVVAGPVPVAGAQDVLIAVHYAGVNGPDIVQRKGKYPPPPGASPVLGLEVSGNIAAVGAEVTQWKVGDAVCALTPGGGYAEYCVAPAAHCLPLPGGFDLERAAAIPENFFTVWTNLIERARLASGETVLIHGGSGGIGYSAIQVAKAWGATVIATVGNAEKEAFARSVGADHVINYRTHDFAEEARRIVEARGVDVILDMVGGEYFRKNLGLLGLEGRLVQIAFQQGSKFADLDLMPVMMRRLTITGSTLRAQPAQNKARIADGLRAHLWPLFANGALRVVIHRVFEFDDVVAAHTMMESGRHLGKLLLRLR